MVIILFLLLNFAITEYQIPLELSNSYPVEIVIKESKISHFSLLNSTFHQIFESLGGLPLIKMEFNNSKKFLLFDSGTDSILLPNDKCDCNRNVNQSLNITEINKIPTVKKEFSVFLFKGFGLIDTFVLNNTNLKFTLSYLSIIQADDFIFNYYDGIIGEGLRDSYSNSLSFITTLNKNLSITKKQFTYGHYSDSSIETNSALVLGQNNNTYLSSKTFCHSFLQQKDKFIGGFESDNNNWICNLSHIIFSKKENFNKSFSLNDYTTISTGMNYIIAPYKYISFFFNLYFNHPNNTYCFQIAEETYNQRYSIICDIDYDINIFRSVTFVLNGIGYSIHKSQLFTKIQTIEGKFYYLFKIVFSFTENVEWKLGWPFLNNFESFTFDKGENIIYFNTSRFIDYTNFTFDSQGILQKAFSFNIFIVLIVVASLGLIGFGIYLIRIFFYDEEQDDLEENAEELQEVEENHIQPTKPIIHESKIEESKIEESKIDFKDTRTNFNAHTTTLNLNNISEMKMIPKLDLFKK